MSGKAGVTESEIRARCKFKILCIYSGIFNLRCVFCGLLNTVKNSCNFNLMVMEVLIHATLNLVYVCNVKLKYFYINFFNASSIKCINVSVYARNL